MCGITGLIAAEPGEIRAQSVVERMQMKLAHRGPDDRGLFVSEHSRCALAHTRLSILDLSPAGHQPMGWGELGAGSWELGAGNREQGARSKEQGAWSKGQGARYWITYNGEIYNYKELREELS